MGATKRSESTAGASEQRTVPRWTWLEVLGLVVSAALIAAPFLTLVFAFAFPPTAPAEPLWPTAGGPTPTPEITPTDTPTPTPTSEFPPTNTPIPTDTPGPTATPVPTNTPIPTATPAPTNTPAASPLLVSKAANRDVAYPGDTVVFTIGLSNQTGAQVTVTLNDTLPTQMSYSNGWYTCAGGSSITPGGGGYSASMVVPNGETCQLVVAVIVNSGCDCYVQNAASWNGGGYSGIVRSQRIWLTAATPVPPTTAVPVTTAIPPTTAVPVTTAIPPTTAAPAPTTAAPAPTTAAPAPTTAAPAPTTAVPVPTTAVPAPTTAVPVPTTPGVLPTPRPTERPRNTREPTEPPPPPPPPCAQARVAGNVCAAGVKVTISSCCPAWSAQTTSTASGYFEFGSLTPGTFTVSAQGRSRTVRLEKCDSAVTVNLCPVTAAPTTPVTPVSPVATGPTLTTTVSQSPSGTHLPTESYLLLETVGEDNRFLPGENVALRLTLHNGEKMRTFRGIIVGITFDNALELLGAASAKGEILISGQRFVLSGATLAPTNDLVVHLNAAVRADTPSGTVIDLRGTARTDAGDMLDSNALQIEVWGEGLAPPPAGGTPLGVVTPPGGGPEPQPTTAPTTPGTQTPILPPTSAGMPIVGVMLGSGVLLARQLRLRKAGRRKPE